MRALVTGATGAVGGRLATALAERGHEVRCLVRDRGRARHLEEAGFDLHEGDVLDADSLRGAGRDVDFAYYLVHSMGRGAGGGDFASRERQAAEAFAAMTRAEGVGRVAYLGGLGGDEPKSQHLRSRHETAEILRAKGPDLTYFRAAMVVGAASESYRTMRYLVERLPAMITPRWIDTRSQPVAIADVLGTLVALADRHDVHREIELGGADVLTYREMIERFTEIEGRRRRIIVKVPVLTPRLSSYWVGLVTPVEAGLARPLVEGLSAEMIVKRPPPPGLNDDPKGFEEAVRAALG